MNTLKAEKRDLQNKAKKLRREGWVTGNVFGKNIEGSIPVQIPVLEAEAFLKKNREGTKLVLEVDQEPMNVIIKEVQFNFLQHQFLEVDFQTLSDEEAAEE